MTDKLSPDDYKIAESNGINKRMAYQRYYDYGWDKTRAITQPINKSYGINAKARRKYEDKYYDLAEKNGIGIQLMHKRMYEGWSILEASTIKPNRTGRPQAHEQKYYDLALENGISRELFNKRVSRGWSFEKAYSTKVQGVKGDVDMLDTVVKKMKDLELERDRLYEDIYRCENKLSREQLCEYVKILNFTITTLKALLEENSKK